MSSEWGPAQDDEFVEVLGRRIHYRWIRPDLGSAPLVFLHEGLGSVELWRDYPDLLVEASGRPGLVFSRHGNGWSDPIGEPRSPDYMHGEALETLPSIIDELVGTPPVLIGHSDGASISIIYAGSGHPVAGLVLIAPHVFTEEMGLAQIASVSESFPGSELAEKMAKYHHLPETTFRAWADIWLSPEFRAWNIEEYLGDIRCPTLVIQGDADEYGTLAQVEAIESQVSAPVERVVVAEANHAPHISHPEVVLAATKRFLAGLPGGAP